MTILNESGFICKVCGELKPAEEFEMSPFPTKNILAGSFNVYLKEWCKDCSTNDSVGHVIIPEGISSQSNERS